jgi:RNA polymerase sigma-70 factor (ECF subfamily)
LAASPAETIDPAVAAEQADDGRMLRAALARLSQRAATVLVLRHSGLSYAAVATAMGVKQGAVGTMVRRAESALRKEVGRAASQ